MDGLIPWQQLEETHQPGLSQAGRGRRPYPLAVMLRVHCVQVFYNLSGSGGMEDLLYEAESVRRFVDLSLSEALPDETTINPCIDKRCLSRLPFRNCSWFRFQVPSSVPMQETQPSWAEIRPGPTQAKIQSRPEAGRSSASVPDLLPAVDGRPVAAKERRRGSAGNRRYGGR